MSVLEHRWLRRVRYRECDPMGVVYHTRYLDFFEEARTEMIREWGLSYAQLEARGVAMPVIRCELRFRLPARYDDELEVTTRLEAIPRAKIVLHGEIRRRGEAAMLVTGTIELAFIDSSSGRPRRPPEELVERIVATSERQSS